MITKHRHSGSRQVAALAAALLLMGCEATRRTGPGSELTALRIVPDDVSIATSQQVRFHASATTASGETREVAASWEATGGTIDGTGLYVAGSSAGQFEVTAAADALVATATIHHHGALKAVVLMPAATTIAEGGQVNFSAYGMSANGDSVLVSPTYSATGGTIDTGGVYTAGSTPGTYLVVATAVVNPSGSTTADTSAVTVGGGSTVPVASVEVTPASASIAAGASVQLAATPRDANGNPLTGRPITWTTNAAAIASVDNSGLVTGLAEGSATITATAEGQSGSAAITVAATGGTAVFVGAGDIADCSSTGDEATATLLDGIPGSVFALGDNAYPDGSATDYQQCYDPTWGRHRARTRPAPGNHDYHTSGAAAYYAYFDTLAGPAGRGYYSFDIGDWHIVSLNSEISMSAGSAQETWLRADLAASTRQCTLAYWHKPRFSSGTKHGNETAAAPLWLALYDFHAEIVLGGHEHNYERFAPQTPDGQADPVNGIREFVVGTGGRSHYNDEGTPLPTSEVFNGTTYGVLKLTLGAGTYSWQFVPVAGGTFTDSGSGTCH